MKPLITEKSEALILINELCYSIKHMDDKLKYEREDELSAEMKNTNKTSMNRKKF